MDDLEFGNEVTVFFTVGSLKELLKAYPDNTPLTICGAPGTFQADEETHCIILEPTDMCHYMIEDDIAGQEYMDF